ncbi:MAG: dienelactone hydrolase family protein [Nitrospiraceae bacterium]|nr:dienelactone hydrolase family protein [Nitrospiraceae bacterium]
MEQKQQMDHVFEEWGKNGLFAEIKTTKVELGKGLTGVMALPDGKGPHPAVIVIMEAFGLNDFVVDVVRLFAREGYAALAPDVYHGALYDYDNFTPAIEHLSKLKDSEVVAEIGMAIDFLSHQKEVDPGSLAVTGFCMGGRLSFLSLASYPEKLKASVAFYPGSLGIEGKDRLGREGVLSKADKLAHPVLFLYGAEDPSIPPSEHAKIVQTLGEMKKEYVLATYPGAGHGFFNGRRNSYHLESAKKAWGLVRTFLHSCLAGSVPS